MASRGSLLMRANETVPVVLSLAESAQFESWVAVGSWLASDLRLRHNASGTSTTQADATVSISGFLLYDPRVALAHALLLGRSGAYRAVSCGIDAAPTRR